MTERVDFHRHKDGRQPPKGSWAKWGEHGVVLACPKCGGVSMLDHEVDAEGVVTPSIVHVPCGWHGFGRLVGWTPPPRQS